MDQSRDDFVIAIRSAFLKKGNKQRFSLLSLILFSIIFLILGNFNFKIINFNKTVIKEIVYLSSFIVSVPENIIKNSFKNVSDHFNHYEDYQTNKSKLQELESKDLSKEIIEFENMELKRLIEDYFVEDEQVYAKVLIDKESPFLRSIVINKGSKNGVLAGMVVFDDIYLIGKVVEVNFLTSRVLLISDINSKVPVTIQSINIEAIMSGLSQQQGILEYIKGEQLKGIKDQELIVVTSGSGGVFKSGIPVGKINLNEFVSNNQMVVNFYKDFSQLKYVKISSYQKDVKLDQSNKKIYNEGKSQILKINNLIEEIKVLKQQKNIADEIRNKFENENTELKQGLIKAQRELIELNKNIDKVKKDKEKIKFLELNLLYGPKCRKTFLKSSLFKIGTPEYKNCVLNQGVIKN